MWVWNHTLLEIVLRTVVVYTVMLIGIRLTGKREVGQMTPFDLVMVLLIANAVQNSMVGPDVSLNGGLVSAVTLLALNALVTRAVWRYKKVRRWVEGSPTLLVHNGLVLKDHLAKERLTLDDLRQVLREHGVASVSDVKVAVLEVDGTVSVLKYDDLPEAVRPHHRIRFIHRGSN